MITNHNLYKTKCGIIYNLLFYLVWFPRLCLFDLLIPFVFDKFDFVSRRQPASGLRYEIFVFTGYFMMTRVFLNGSCGYVVFKSFDRDIMGTMTVVEYRVINGVQKRQ